MEKYITKNFQKSPNLVIQVAILKSQFEVLSSLKMIKIGQKNLHNAFVVKLYGPGP